jgi:vacuolar-type H+-ATPase subunit C/Vma6
MVRMFARGSTEELPIEPLIFSLRRYHTIPVEDALEAEDLESLMELMKRTPFARALEIGYRQYEDEGEIFPLELALDLDYYDRLWKAMDALGPLDKHNTARLLGIRYDITNIIWMLRFKEYHGFSPEQLSQYIIPHGWKIRGNEFWRAAVDSDVTDAIIALQISPYDDLFKSVSRVDGSFIMGAEIHLLRYLYRESLEIFMRFPLQSAQLVAFFICKEMEIRDIIAVLAGRNLELSQERIRSYMVTV